MALPQPCRLIWLSLPQRSVNSDLMQMSESLKSYLSRILRQHRSVCLEGIGTLRLGLLSAKIDHSNGIVYPPRRQIYFVPHADQELDPVLVQVIALVDRIPKDSATTKSATFMHELRDELQTKKFLEIPNVGIIRQNFWGVTYFEPASYGLGMDEYFGLPEVPLPKVIPNTANEPLSKRESVEGKKQITNKIPESSPRGRRWGFTLGVLVLVLASVFALSLIPGKQAPQIAEQVQSVKQDSKRLNIAPELPQEDKVVVVPKRKSDVNSEKPQTRSAPITGGVAIVVGSFANPENAQRVVDRIEKFAMTPYTKVGSLTTVGIVISDQQDLAEKLAWARSEFDQEAWVLKLDQ